MAISPGRDAGAGLLMMSAVDGHLCVELHRLRHRAAPAQATPEPDTARVWESA